MPSLREKKRYLAFEAISGSSKLSFLEVSGQIRQSCFDLLGEIECAKAGILTLKDKWDNQAQRGIIRVNNKYLGHLRAAMAVSGNAGETPLVLRSLGASGMLNKAESCLKE